jgi:replicative DNA helicase
MAPRTKKKPEDTPPPASANPEAEAALLGMILCDQRRFHDVADRLRAEDFASERNQIIWRGMLSLVATGRHVIRQVLLAEIGEAETKTDEIDLAGYLRALQAEGGKQTGSIGEFLEAVKSAATGRELEAYGCWIKDELSKARITNIEDALAEAKHRLSLIGSADGDDAASIAVVSERVVASSTQVRNKEKPSGLKTGLKFIDGLVGSLLPGQLIVIAGPAGAGKTAIGMQIGLVLAQLGYPVHAFSLEMESEEVAGRMLAAFSKVSADKIIEGDVTDEQMAKVVDVERSFREVPFFIDARTKPTTSTLLTRATRSIAKNGTRLFITDHLRMVRPDNYKQDERERIEQVVQDHKAMAKRLGVPWILLAHTQRTDMHGVKTAKDIRRPSMNNLYGSSAVENTADIILFVHRPWMILQDARPADTASHYGDWAADVEAWKGKAQIILAKRRGGKGRGTKTCLYEAEQTWFCERPEFEYTGEAPT